MGWPESAGRLQPWDFIGLESSPSLESLMADINTTLETLTARIDQLVADLQATNPTPAAAPPVAPAPPARTRWTFETEWRKPAEGELFVEAHQAFAATHDFHHYHMDVIVPGSVTRLDP